MFLLLFRQPRLNQISTYFSSACDLNLVELNAFLYKYETDFALLIRNEFEDHFTTASGKKYTSQYFKIRAKERKERVNQLLWNESEHCYFDYHWKTQRPHPFISATSLLPLWAELCSHEQAEQLVTYILPKLKEKGGISSCTEESRGTLGPNRPQKQWDYPNGWAPHQMMIWKGLLQYGYRDEAQELIYRWLYMITKNAVDYNGTIPEKYDVVQATHKVFAEYGNVGTDFEYITTEGFGWMNASFQYGLSLLEKQFITRVFKKNMPVFDLASGTKWSSSTSFSDRWRHGNWEFCVRRPCSHWVQLGFGGG